MTEQTWNKEQIEAAIIKAEEYATCVDTAAYVMAELIKSRWTPQANEVYYHEEDHNYYKTSDIPSDYHPDIVRRPLTPSEVPALALAIKNWEWLACNGIAAETRTFAQTVLDNIEELL